jgi:hypothetical protein
MAVMIINPLKIREIAEAKTEDPCCQNFSIKLLLHPPWDPTYLGPQTQPRAAATTATFATAQSSSD